MNIQTPSCTMGSPLLVELVATGNRGEGRVVAVPDHVTDHITPHPPHYPHYSIPHTHHSWPHPLLGRGRAAK